MHFEVSKPGARIDGWDGFGAVASRMIATPDVHDRFALLAASVRALGFETVNYGFFDPMAPVGGAGDICYLSNLRSDFLDHYHAEGMVAHDAHVLACWNNNLTPYLWGSTKAARLEDQRVRRVDDEKREAGVRSSIFVPLASTSMPGRCVGGLTLGSPMEDRDLFGSVRDQTDNLVALAHVFHSLSLGSLLRLRTGAKSLTARQRDCLTWLASGLRPDAIADRLGLARVTVDLHLREARLKLGARSLTEAVARAITFGEISLV